MSIEDLTICVHNTQMRVDDDTPVSRLLCRCQTNLNPVLGDKVGHHPHVSSFVLMQGSIGVRRIYKRGTGFRKTS